MGGKPSSGTPADKRIKSNPGKGSESGSAPQSKSGSKPKPAAGSKGKGK